MFEDYEDLSALVDEAVSTITLYRIDYPSGVTYRLDDESAREAVIAYALSDRLAFETPEEVPAAHVWTEEDGSITVRERVA